MSNIPKDSSGLTLDSETLVSILSTKAITTKTSPTNLVAAALSAASPLQVANRLLEKPERGTDKLQKLNLEKGLVSWTN